MLFYDENNPTYKYKAESIGNGHTTLGSLYLEKPHTKSSVVHLSLPLPDLNNEQKKVLVYDMLDFLLQADS